MGAKFGTGYGSLSAGGKAVYVHRRAYELANGPIPGGLVVRHKCDVKLCVRPDHLEVGTQADNVRDKVERGRHPRGEQGPNAKLTAAQVTEIRVKYAAGGRTQRSLADEYGMHWVTVHDIVRGKRWVAGVST
jgi:hypothetical protein